MSYTEFISKRESWEAFLEKESEREFKDEKLIKDIENVLKEKRYNKFTQEFLVNFELPRRVLLSKHNTSKKREVYVYPGDHMLLLKITAMYLLKNYNKKFCYNSIAYTEGKSVRTAFHLLKSYKLTGKDTVYKADFSDYFNSIDIKLLNEKLKEFLKRDKDLHEFIMQLLRETKVRYKGDIIEVKRKGVMAGSPISGILANIFMNDVDFLMAENGYKYIRYADDVLIVGKVALSFFKEKIKLLGIELNPKKTAVYNINTGIVFLGFIHKGNTIDIAPEAVSKMKSRLKRRAKWYRVWLNKNNVRRTVAIKDYIKKLNYKIFSDQEDSINWSRWYFPNINTTKSIKYLEDYFINCIRYLDSGTWRRGDKYYRLSYRMIKNMGYRSLINEYYKIRKLKNK